MTLDYSRRRIDLAGDRLREHDRGGLQLGPGELGYELRVVESLRAAHARPLTRVAAGLRYYAREASEQNFTVAQRLKRMSTIRDKLQRHQRMQLSRMHDIGGCRVVLPDQDAADQVIARLQAQRRWQLRDRVWDYVTNPKPDGYRAKHLVVVKDGVLVEVQLRTELQHAWAELVERVDRLVGAGLKGGGGDPGLAAALAYAGDRMSALDRGEMVEAEILEALRLLATRADVS